MITFNNASKSFILDHALNEYFLRNSQSVGLTDIQSRIYYKMQIALAYLNGHGVFDVTYADLLKAACSSVKYAVYSSDYFSASKCNGNSLFECYRADCGNSLFDKSNTTETITSKIYMAPEIFGGNDSMPIIVEFNPYYIQPFIDRAVTHEHLSTPDDGFTTINSELDQILSDDDFDTNAETNVSPIVTEVDTDVDVDSTLDEYPVEYFREDDPRIAPEFAPVFTPITSDVIEPCIAPANHREWVENEFIYYYWYIRSSHPAAKLKMRGNFFTVTNNRIYTAFHNIAVNLRKTLFDSRNFSYLVELTDLHNYMDTYFALYAVEKLGRTNETEAFFYNAVSNKLADQCVEWYKHQKKRGGKACKGCKAITPGDVSMCIYTLFDPKYAKQINKNANAALLEYLNDKYPEIYKLYLSTRSKYAKNYLTNKLQEYELNTISWTACLINRQLREQRLPGMVVTLHNNVYCTENLYGDILDPDEVKNMIIGTIYAYFDHAAVVHDRTAKTIDPDTIKRINDTINNC